MTRHHPLDFKDLTFAHAKWMPRGRCKTRRVGITSGGGGRFRSRPFSKMQSTKGRCCACASRSVSPASCIRDDGNFPPAVVETPTGEGGAREARGACRRRTSINSAITRQEEEATILFALSLTSAELFPCFCSYSAYFWPPYASRKI